MLKPEPIPNGNDVLATCGSCRFHDGHNLGGMCRRYPDPREKYATDWCGEYRSGFDVAGDRVLKNIAGETLEHML